MGNVAGTAWEKVRKQAIEANQIFFRSDPQVAVGGLSQRGNLAAVKTLIAAPALTHVLSQKKIWIESMRQGCGAGQGHRDEQASTEKAPPTARFKPDILISQPQPHSLFATAFFRSRLHRT